MTLLLLGAGGQVGWALGRALAPVGTVAAYDRSAVDVTDGDALARLVDRMRPSVIVNAAAYTAVDKAESERDVARAVNADAPRRLAAMAADIGALLVHYSTDYVFDGTKTGAYVETDRVNPISVYGETKAAGEDAIRAAGCSHLIFRTSWVYGWHGRNFAKTILRAASTRPDLAVVEDQIGAPTNAGLIADVTAHCILAWLRDRTSSGTFHLAAADTTSWHGFAKFLVTTATALGLPLATAPDSVRAISTAEYPTAARRPANSSLDTGKLRATFGLHLPPWQVHAARLVQMIADGRNG